MLKLPFFYLGYPQLFSQPAPDLGRERFDLEVPLLPHKRQTRAYQVSQVGDVARPVGSETGGGRTVATVDRD